VEGRLEDAKAENAALKAAKAALEGRMSELQAQTTSHLAGVRTAVAALQTLLPSAPAPAFLTFDRVWCTAACGSKWKVDIDATGARAHVTQEGGDHVSLRSAAPLPRPPSRARDPEQGQLPMYRIVVEAYGGKLSCCSLGFLPSHHTRTGAAVTPVEESSISEHGGWYMMVFPILVIDALRSVDGGWTALKPSESVYATTDEIPPVPEGSAVEFAVDYAAGTCCVAFYTASAVAGGFVQAPHAKMELRFVATETTQPLSALAESGVELYPAVCTLNAGTTWRFVS
jgi:hypothetical protein